MKRTGTKVEPLIIVGGASRMTFLSFTSAVELPTTSTILLVPFVAVIV